jgi:uncharacterized protein (TIGR03067 family)
MKGDAMRIFAAAAILVISHSIFAADAPLQDAGKQELEKLQGTWVVISAEADGQKAPDGTVKAFKMVVKGNKLTFNPQAHKRESVFELDPTKLPKQIIVTPLDGPRKGNSQRGLYSLEKGLLTLCLNTDPHGTAGPPAEFSTHAGDGLRLLVLKPEKPEGSKAK